MIVLNPLVGLLFLVSTGLDIVTFFLTVHLLLLWRQMHWLARLDRIGEPLVNSLVQWMDEFVRKQLRRRWSQRSLICLVLMMVFVLKVALGLLLKGLTV